MPRGPRIALAGIPCHIIHRGNNRRACFFLPSDYSYYLGTLAEQAAKFDCQLHAYVLMTNHVHLLITPSRKESASLMMKAVAQRYTQFINRRDGKSGTLWDGRFKSCVAQDDAYVLTCYRYIELNPVRACMVGHPADYYWSSFGVNGAGKSSSLITPHADYLALGGDSTARLARYNQLFATALSETELRMIRQATNGNLALGTEAFLENLQTQLNRRVTRINQRSDRPPKGDRPLSD